MRGNPGLLLEIEGGGKAISYHKEQLKEFVDLKKQFIHYIDDNYQPIMINGKPKTGLKANDKLKVIGRID